MLAAIDRNHLAVWLVLVSSVVTGYLTMRVRACMRERSGHGWRATIVALSDGDSLGILGCVAAMLITLAATLSRSGFTALAASAVASLWEAPLRTPANLLLAAILAALAVRPARGTAPAEEPPPA